jgi:hypothetical protein
MTKAGCGRSAITASWLFFKRLLGGPTMRSISPVFDDVVIERMASDRAPTIQEPIHVAERIWAEGAAD